ncbi:amino acid ABC transporter permease [Paracoccus laeviglucosivorans]|uniref:Amino acid ABC transporter membrane protein 1, PAAT family n=1 Tax=Paracoccus laeviglucosivorans TaxID=1197861 RepID=A0A521FJM6_9RHOB|nr:amino acid ABC transporter permease [Paracoccus laeviglucosivorans]SMO96355.1 amino acid ABC transporter membrane protein 1, PAAT family [Paracoccus laeviglucosivorans]
MNYTFDFTPIFQAWGLLAQGAWATVYISAISMALGLVFGIVLTALRMAPLAPLRAFAIGYIELVRNTPFLVQVFFIYFGMPELGLRLNAMEAAILTMTLNCSAYIAEIVRSGVESIRPGQIEAGKALGLSTPDVYRFIVFRPAIRAVYPSLCSQFVLMMLNTSLVASISAQELTYAAQMIDNRTFRSFEVYFVLGAIYLVLSQLFSVGLSMIGRVYFSYPTK